MKYFVFICLALCISSCDKALLGDEDRMVSLEENLLPPPALNDGWEVSTLAAQNIKPERIQDLISSLQQEAHNIHSLLIFRNNKLVSESYFDGWHRSRLHTLRSVSKSFISTLVGIAIDKGKISSVKEKVFDFFPAYADLKTLQKAQIELQHVLTMTSGLQWQESLPENDPKDDEVAVDLSKDRLRYLLQKDLVSTPGTVFNYNSGGQIIQASILHKAIGEEVELFAKKNLFTPLNITNYYWRKHEDGEITAVPISLVPRDMAKLGQLFLDSGKWKGQQIVSANWVSQATATFIGSEERASGYGYNWWTASYRINNNSIRIISARGHGGQYIFIVPALQAVVVFTGGNFRPLNQAAPFGIMTNVILPAMF